MSLCRTSIYIITLILLMIFIQSQNRSWKNDSAEYYNLEQVKWAIRLVPGGTFCYLTQSLTQRIYASLPAHSSQTLMSIGATSKAWRIGPTQILTQMLSCCTSCYCCLTCRTFLRQPCLRQPKCFWRPGWPNFCVSPSGADRPPGISGLSQKKRQTPQGKLDHI